MQQAISSPLLEDVSIDGATGLLINITGGRDMTLQEVNEALTLVHDAADDEAEIIFGSLIDENVARRGEDHHHRHRLRAPRRRAAPPGAGAPAHVRDPSGACRSRRARRAGPGRAARAPRRPSRGRWPPPVR